MVEAWSRWWPKSCGSSADYWDYSLANFDEDALTRALFGRIDGGFIRTLGNRGEPTRATRVVDGVAVLHVGKPIVEQREHVGSDLDADAVARAQILIDPDLHVMLLQETSTRGQQLTDCAVIGGGIGGGFADVTAIFNMSDVPGTRRCRSRV